MNRISPSLMASVETPGLPGQQGLPVAESPATTRRSVPDSALADVTGVSRGSVEPASVLLPESVAGALSAPGVTDADLDVTPSESITIGTSQASVFGDVARRAIQGDSAAVEELLVGVHRRAYRYARAKLGHFPQSLQAAEDAAQEVCIAVLTSLPRYTERGVPFEAFVYRICRHKVRDVQRAAYRIPVPTDTFPEEVDPAAGPEERAIRHDEVDQVMAHLSRLPEQQREILTLRIGVGLSAAETAEALGMKPGAVRVAQHRALAKLRAMLSEEERA